MIIDSCMHAQSHLTLCDTMDWSHQGASVHGIVQAGIVEWVAISFTRGCYWPGIEPMSCTSPALAGRFFYHSAAWEALTDSCVHAKSPQSCLILCDLWTLALQAPLSMGFSRQEYWSGFPCPPPGDLPDPGIKPVFLNVSCISRQVLYH